MSTATPQRPARLNDTLSEILGADVPETVSASWVARTFGIERPTVVHAITTGKLPSLAETDEKGRILAHVVRPGDALLVWGWRLFKPSKPETKTT